MACPVCARRWDNFVKIALGLGLASMLTMLGCSGKPSARYPSDSNTGVGTRSSPEASPREILAHQPDFAADVIFTQSEPRIHGGFSIGSKIAKKGDVYREDFERQAFFFRPHLPILNYFPKRNRITVVDSPGDITWHRDADHPQLFANAANIEFTDTGTEVIDGHECMKIAATTTESQGDETVTLYAAKDLNGLVILVEINLSDRTNRYLLKNISFDVPNSLFAPLVNYRS